MMEGALEGKGRSEHRTEQRIGKARKQKFLE
jgi:hypothetical protein